MSIATVPDSRRQSSPPPRLDFETIFREHSPMIYRTAYAVTGNQQDADDVLQTVFLKLIRREYPPDLKTNPKAYLHRAAVNLSLDVLRSRRRYTSTEGLEGFDIAVTNPNEAETPVELDAILTKLEPDAAHILVLRYVHDYSDAEIAKMLGRSRGSIALRLFRLRARVKKILRSLPGEKS